MKHPKYIFAYFLIAFLLISCGSDDSNNNQPPVSLDATQYYEELNVSYGSDADQVFDLYLPANRSNITKVMILVHGGAWIEGDKADMDGIKDIMRLDLPNVAIVNMNYRLADQNNLPLPMQTNDITAVINTIKANQEYYTVSDDFGFIGVSAGGHLSLLWSYTEDVNHQVSASAQPTILFYGGEDPLVPTSQGVDMDARLEELGVTHEFTLYPNEGHGWTGLNLLDTWTKLKLFTETHLINN